MDIVSVPDAIEWQAHHAQEAGAPGTARIVRALLALDGSDTATARRIFSWQGLSLRDAMPLRIVGGLHNLLLTGDAPRLGDVYAGRIVSQHDVDALVLDLVEAFDARLLPWLDGPPQTNEAGRSASFAAALAWLASGRTPPRFAILEIGASAGINTMMGRYRYDLGGYAAGPAGSPMRIVPEWRGEPLVGAEYHIVSACGCDVAPVDLGEREAALRLKAYVWPEATERMARIDTAIAMAKDEPPMLDRADAAEWVEHMLAEPAQDGVTRVLMHSIMWQYLSDAAQDRIEGLIVDAGKQATSSSPLAHVALETNRATFQHELRVRYWPGGARPVHLANAHPHGAWIEWLG